MSQTFSRIIRNATGVWIAGISLGACTGLQTSSPSSPKGVLASSFLSACSNVKKGEARCGALVRYSGADTSSSWTPGQLEEAYNLPSKSKGTGQIVAIVDAYDNPKVASDLAEYRSNFGLPEANFKKYNQNGQQKDYPRGDASWGLEIDQDVDMVSASCPNCAIYLVEANSDQWSDLEVAESEAVALGAHIVSNSYAGTGGDQSYYDANGVAYLGAGGPEYGEPADWDSVVAVGGTVLSQGGGGKRGWTETVYSNAGGGCIQEEPKPPWQHVRGCKYRQANDVAAVALGVAEYDSYKYGGWYTGGGTGVSTPFLAGVFGLAGNAAKQDGGRTFWQRPHQKHLYRVQESGKYVRYSSGAGWGTPDGVGAF
jgi:subtilase family serine protease